MPTAFGAVDRNLNFANFQPFAKIFKRKFLTCGMQCTCAVNSQNYFNEFFKNRYS